MSSISDYELIDHGIDGSQYFPGCCTSHTRFEHVATGHGDSFADAIADALDFASTGEYRIEAVEGKESEKTHDIDWDAFEAYMLRTEGLTEWPTEPSASAYIEDNLEDGDNLEEALEESELYYYVSIRFNIQRDLTKVELAKLEDECEQYKANYGYN
jgi:hypothetical protein